MKKESEVGIVVVFIITLLLFLPFVSAANFELVSITKTTQGTPYRGEPVSYTGIIKEYSDNICQLECSYSGTDSGYVSDDGNSPATRISHQNPSQEFPIDVQTSGSSPMTISITISCTPQWALNCLDTSPISHSYTKTLSFLYPGDGICTTSKEKCADYGSFLKDTVCSCSSTKECRPDGSRNPDSNGCQTYCGNGICESSYESCVGKSDGKDCSDCKKCDLVTCTYGSECEGGYCVWGYCWKSSTRVGDGHCDSDKGENCGISPADCACQTGQKCSTTTNQCETYCGNGICEESEKGNCQADCKWCGDGSCDSTQNENCKNCEPDCGVCENTQLNEEISNKTQTIIEKGISDIKQKQNIITYSALGAIALFIIGYISLKIIKQKKKPSEKEKVDKKK